MPSESKLRQMIEYVLKNIYKEKWKPADKLPSVNQFAIKFNLSHSTVKKELERLKNSNFLVSKERKGFFVNPFLFEALPLSICKKYNLSLKEVKFEKIKNGIKLKKIYKDNQFNEKPCDIFVDCEIISNALNDKNYNIKKTFMFNIASEGLIPTKFFSKFELEYHNQIGYIVETRNLYNFDHIQLVKEKIYIPILLWKNFQKIDL